jgi:hypothetical protein
VESLENLRYVSMHSIWEALARREGEPPPGTILVKGSWIKALWEDEKILPRRQDLPPEAIWNPLELQALVEAKRAEIVAVSHCWLRPDHPDPDGEKLALLGELIEQRLNCKTIPIDDLGLFIDWCSLLQSPETQQDKLCFEHGLSKVSLWFTHAQTFVWMLRTVPDGVTAYDDRGWPTFERQVGDLLTETGKLIDLGDFDEESCTSWFSTYQVCREARRPPLEPEAFAQELATKAFTKEEDRELVEDLYRKTFMEVMNVAKVLKYKSVGWTMPEIATFADCLPHCRIVTTLSLTENNVGSAEGERPLAASALAAHLPKCTKLRRFMLRACSLGDEDMAVLAPCIPRCLSLTTLNLMDNKIGPIGASELAKVLPECPRLRQLILAGNNVGEVGAIKLAEKAPKCETLLELWMTGCGDLGKGQVYLTEKWKEGGKMWGDLHF